MAKVAGQGTTATTKMIQETAVEAGVMMSHDIIAGVAIYEILQARYADGR